MEKKGQVKEKQKVVENTSERKFVTDKDIAMDFADLVQKKFDRLVKSIVLFGSQTRADASPGSDIDIIIVVDDASINWDLELVSWYREELGKLIVSTGHDRDLHINTIKLTTFWQDLMQGDPVVINILRYGEALIDYGGFFNPLKSLLLQGKIHSTAEAVYTGLERSPSHLARSKSSLLSAIEGVYWCMTDSAQAALMMAGKLPPSPEKIPDMLSETFVQKGVLKEGFVKALRDVYNLHKNIAHGEITRVKGSEIDQWQDVAEKFLAQMASIVDGMLESKR